MLRRTVWPALGLGAVTLTIANLVVSGDEWSLMFIGFGVVGAFVSWKVPEHLTGPLMVGLSLVAALDSEVLHVFDPVAVWIGVAMPLLLGLFILSFPSGRLPRGWWRPVMGVALVLTVIGFAMATRAGDESSLVAVPLAMFILAALVDLFLRYRRFDPEQKAQTKLVVFAAALTPVLLVVSVLTVMSEDWLGVWGVTAFMIIPISVGVAMARFRLYDIDRIISRTLTYAIVVGLLGSAYVTTVWVVTLLVPAQGSLAVAASTLAVAGIFNPLRKRVQRVVDRRFNRSHYRFEVVAEEFIAKLERSLTIEEVVNELSHTVAITLQPQSSALWVASARERSVTPS